MRTQTEPLPRSIVEPGARLRQRLDLQPIRPASILQKARQKETKPSPLRDVRSPLFPATSLLSFSFCK
jgi:hypothetical protein